ncbi:unnamed protein product [Paramecium octaurelia]|uniref:Uncharacterized protein n=1 Tax=Paramecium octaurelia TaxID=43137 RepID=A0A8S1WPD8_PAROT|nr:unnamed protein product [Paramecium octaurelia]
MQKLETMDEDESTSFHELPINDRVSNLQQIQTWFQNQKLAITNTELFTTQIFDDLRKYCEQSNEILQASSEFQETKELIHSFYNKAQRICLKIKKKTEPRSQLQERIRYYKVKEDEEVEKNREILIEVKKKLLCIIRISKGIPFIINFIKSQNVRDKQYKLTLMVEDALLDGVNWYLMLNDIKESQWNKELPQECKLKEILQQLLTIIWQQRQELKNELNEIFFKLKKTQLIKLLDKQGEKFEKNDKFTQQSTKILQKLQEFCNGLENIKLSQNKANGLYYLQRILLSYCWVKQIELSEMLYHTKITGRLDKLKQDKDHSNVIRLRQKITFLRFVYRIPAVKQWCEQNQIIPFEMQSNIPQYLQEQYDQFMSDKKERLFSDTKEDYFIESQLKFLANNFQVYKNKIRIIFNDLRFIQNKQEIYELYQEYVNKYDGDIDKVQNLQFQKQQKDIIIACCIRHLEIKLQNEDFTKAVIPLVKFDFLLKKEKHFQFQQTSYDKSQYSFLAKPSLVKIFLIDILAQEQPFPYIFEFIYYEDGKLQQFMKSTTLQGQFFYCPQIREHLSKRYQFNIKLIENENKVTFTYLPTIHYDYVKPAATVLWEDILLQDLKLISLHRNQLLDEINFMVRSNKFQTIKQQIQQDAKYFSDHLKIMNELEVFNSLQSNGKKLRCI